MRELTLLIVFISLMAISEAIFLSTMPKMYLSVFLQCGVSSFRKG